MYPDRGIVRTYIRSYGISTRPYGLNTLTHQPSGTNNAPQGPPSWPCYNVLLLFLNNWFLQGK